MYTVLIFALYLVQYSAGDSDLRKNLNYFEVLHAKQFGHNIVKRGTQPSNHPFNKIREVNFKALGRDFRSMADHLVASLSSYLISSDASHLPKVHFLKENT